MNFKSYQALTSVFIELGTSLIERDLIHTSLAGGQIDIKQLSEQSKAVLICFKHFIKPPKPQKTRNAESYARRKAKKQAEQKQRVKEFIQLDSLKPYKQKRDNFSAFSSIYPKIDKEAENVFKNHAIDFNNNLAFNDLKDQINYYLWAVNYVKVRPIKASEFLENFKPYRDVKFFNKIIHKALPQEFKHVPTCENKEDITFYNKVVPGLFSESITTQDAREAA